MVLTTLLIMVIPRCFIHENSIFLWKVSLFYNEKKELILIRKLYIAEDNDY